MPLFKLGNIVATPAALRHCEQHQINPLRLLSRHVGGDWGDLATEDIDANQNAISYGGRVFSSYRVGDCKVWVITEADRSSTCLLMPDEY